MCWSAVCDYGISYSYLLAFLNNIKYHVTYNIKELSKSYTVLKAVIYVTYCHTNNKKIINTRKDVGYSILQLNFNIMLIHGV